MGACGSVGRALQSHCRGRGFKSRQVHQGPVAQLGARLNGIEKVEGSSPSGSTCNFIETP